MLKILVCGGRNFTKGYNLRKVLEVLGPAHICHGGARGADYFAGEIAKANGWPVTVYKADWEKYGRSAGIIRNKEMLFGFVPDIVVACRGGIGTEHMKNVAYDNNFPVIEVFQND